MLDPVWESLAKLGYFRSSGRTSLHQTLSSPLLTLVHKPLCFTYATTRSRTPIWLGGRAPPQLDVPMRHPLVVVLGAGRHSAQCVAPGMASHRMVTLPLVTLRGEAARRLHLCRGARAPPAPCESAHDCRASGLSACLLGLLTGTRSHAERSGSHSVILQGSASLRRRRAGRGLACGGFSLGRPPWAGRAAWSTAV